MNQIEEEKVSQQTLRMDSPAAGESEPEQNLFNDGIVSARVVDLNDK